MKLPWLDDLLWVSGLILNVALLILLVWHGGWKQFRFFTCWIAYEAALAVALMALSICGAWHWYSQVYWTNLWPDFLLQLGFVVELAWIVLRRNDRWLPGARDLLVLSGVAALAVAASLSWLIHPPHGRYSAWDLRSDVFTSLVLCQLLVAITVIANRLSASWPRHSRAVAQGITGWCVVTLMVNALQSYFGTRDFRMLNRFQSYAWVLALAWIAIEFGVNHRSAEGAVPEPLAGSLRDGERTPSGRLRSLPPSASIALADPCGSSVPDSHVNEARA